MLYNIFVNRHEINRKFTNELFAYQNMIPRETCKAYHETAHLGGASAKYLFASTQCHYTTASISRAVSQLDNCIYIVSGDKNTDMRAVIKEYTDLNPAIETYLIPNAKVLPQIEQPEEFVNTLNIYINDLICILPVRYDNRLVTLLSYRTDTSYRHLPLYSLKNSRDICSFTYATADFILYLPIIFILLSTLIIAHFFCTFTPTALLRAVLLFSDISSVSASPFTKTNDRSMSVPGSVIFSTLSILPPSRDTALLRPLLPHQYPRTYTQ